MTHLRQALPDDAAAWLRTFGGDLPSAWRICARPDWLLRMCLAVDVGRGLVVHAATDLAADALAANGATDLRPHQALAVTRRWIAGRAAGPEAWALAFAAMEIAEQREGPRAEAIRAAACAAFACDDDADPAFYAHRAYAARAAMHAGVALGDPARAASRVRARIPLCHFMAAFDLAAQPPPPLAGVEASGPTTDSFYC